MSRKKSEHVRTFVIARIVIYPNLCFRTMRLSILPASISKTATTVAVNNSEKTKDKTGSIMVSYPSWSVATVRARKLLNSNIIISKQSCVAACCVLCAVSR